MFLECGHNFGGVVVMLGYVRDVSKLLNTLCVNDTLFRPVFRVSAVSVSAALLSSVRLVTNCLTKTVCLKPLRLFR